MDKEHGQNLLRVPPDKWLWNLRAGVSRLASG
jgi:hypothetical protein